LATSSGTPAQHRGKLTATETASAMQAARLNALDLLDTAEILFQLKRFGHALVFATLAIEEAGKVPILFTLFLETAGAVEDHWRAYRSHRAKTAGLNLAIEARIRAEFPEIPHSEAEALGDAGPSSDDLEFSKQTAIYSDCFVSSQGVICHLPRNVDRRNEAAVRLAEARTLVFGLRDRTPEELEVWLTHTNAAKAEGRDFRSIIKSVHADLLSAGFIREEWWKSLLEDLDRAASA
jgi:AbiV family abortive infection protein